VEQLQTPRQHGPQNLLKYQYKRDLNNSQDTIYSKDATNSKDTHHQQLGLRECQGQHIAKRMAITNSRGIRNIMGSNSKDVDSNETIK
jgi:hypothetical protein